MFIDKTHLPWILLVCGGSPALIALWHCPWWPMIREWLTLGYGCCAVLCCLAANLLVFRKKLAGKTVKLGTYQKAHIWLSLLSVPLVLCHCGMDAGWLLGIGRWLWCVYWTIIITGLLALLAYHLGPLIKAGDKGKAQTAARVITGLKEVSLAIHVPLTGAFWPLLLLHVWAKLRY